MIDHVISLDIFKTSLQPYMTPLNNRTLKTHIKHFSRILHTSTIMTFHSEKLLSQGVTALQSNDYWLQLEIEAQCLNHEDDYLFRRCMIHFSEALGDQSNRPSVIKVNSRNIDCLLWYRKSLVLGSDIKKSLHKWELCSHELKPISLETGVYNSLRCIKWIFDNDEELANELCNVGLIYFGDVFQYNLRFEKLRLRGCKRKWQSSLLSVLEIYFSENFKHYSLSLSGSKVDVTDLYYLSHITVNQLANLALTDRVLGENGHNKKSMVKRFKCTVTSILSVFIMHAKTTKISKLGLDTFELNGFELLKAAKNQLSKYQFRELVLLLGEHRQRPILKHEYQPNLLPFYFSKFDKYRAIDFSELSAKSTNLFNEVKALHQSELRYLLHKNYSMVTLHSRFGTLNSLLLNMLLLTEHMDAANKLGLACLSANKNHIQKEIFQKIQSEVRGEKMTLKCGQSCFEVIRWVMELTGQQVANVYLLSSKRNEEQSKRSRMEDLYTQNELRELMFYVEKGLKQTENNSQREVALYFAKIQLKSCWNTSALMDIELSDISEIELPTEKRAIAVLIQKPRKGYCVDCYYLDGKTVSSIMHDILYMRDIITRSFRKKAGKLEHNVLFIYQERSAVKRLDPHIITPYINSVLKTYGCNVKYNSKRVRLTGSNSLYDEVVKNIRSYKSCMRHDFSTFIENYQRIDETEIHQNLHGAIDTMQKYFTGREISSDIKILLSDDFSLQKTPSGECASLGNDNEAIQYRKEHLQLQKKNNIETVWCSDYLACIWCKYFRTVADPEHVWQLLSYREYVLADMLSSVLGIDNNQMQKDAITALHERVNTILKQLEIKSQSSVTLGKQLLKTKGMHPFWSFAIASPTPQGIIS